MLPRPWLGGDSSAPCLGPGLPLAGESRDALCCCEATGGDACVGVCCACRARISSCCARCSARATKSCVSLWSRWAIAPRRPHSYSTTLYHAPCTPVETRLAAARSFRHTLLDDQMSPGKSCTTRLNKNKSVESTSACWLHYHCHTPHGAAAGTDCPTFGDVHDVPDSRQNLYRLRRGVIVGRHCPRSRAGTLQNKLAGVDLSGRIGKVWRCAPRVHVNRRKPVAPMHKVVACA